MSKYGESDIFTKDPWFNQGCKRMYFKRAIKAGKSGNLEDFYEMRVQFEKKRLVDGDHRTLSINGN